MRFVELNRDIPRLRPPDLRDWVPADHLLHFYLDAVEPLELRGFKINTRGTGDAEYPPAILLVLLTTCVACTSSTGWHNNPWRPEKVHRPSRLRPRRAGQSNFARAKREPKQSVGQGHVVC